MAAVHAYGADAVGRIVVTPAVADLARASVAPAHQLVVVELGAGVLATCGERNRRSPRTKIHDGRLKRIFGARGGPVTQLTVRIAAPTREVAVVQNGAGVLVPSIDGDCVATRSKRAGC